MPATWGSFIKTVSSAGTPVVVGASTLEFSRLQVAGFKSETDQNAGLVYLANTSGGPAQSIYPGQMVIRVAPLGSRFNAAQFFLDALNSGDGALVQYSLEGQKTYHNVEQKLESALASVLRTTGTSLVDCPIVPGITDTEKTGNCVYCSCESAEERVLNTGVWHCVATVYCQTPADDASAPDKHSLKTAYIRDTIFDTQLPELLSAHQPGLRCLGVYDRSAAQRIEERNFVSETRLVIVASANSFTT